MRKLSVANLRKTFENLNHGYLNPVSSYTKESYPLIELK